MYGKLVNGAVIAPPKFHNGIINYNLNTKKLIEDGYKEVIYSEPSQELGEYQEHFCTYEETETEINQIWSVRDIDKSIIINQLKSELEATDYKIIKCSEYQLAGLEAPYNVEELHIERQTIRDKINTLEEAWWNLQRLT